jgi:hypothetical protein
VLKAIVNQAGGQRQVDFRLGGAKRKTGDKPYFALQIRPRRLTAIWFVVWKIALGKLAEIVRLGADALSRSQ